MSSFLVVVFGLLSLSSTALGAESKSTKDDDNLLYDYYMAWDLLTDVAATNCSGRTGGVVSTFSVPSSAWIAFQGQGSEKCFRNRKTFDEKNRKGLGFGCATKIMKAPLTEIAVTPGTLVGYAYVNEFCEQSKDGIFGSYYTMTPSILASITCHEDHDNPAKTWRTKDDKPLNLRYKGCQKAKYDDAKYKLRDTMPVVLATTGETGFEKEKDVSSAIDTGSGVCFFAACALATFIPAFVM